ncbi:ketohexokinase-like isoform X1 [Ptychodera flava]|uniref:ketohexokinase-like isoform X1 n=1 Tax=Ptychodera flava TaxID=63121 RepID=UPI003969D7EC
MGEKGILLVGLACLDIINIMESFPEEDTDSRCREQHWQRGGNASNSSVVLSQLGVKCQYFGTLAKHRLSEFIKDDLDKHGVTVDNCVYHDNCTVPTSCVIVNASNGTRTILHANKNLPELKLEDFERLNPNLYSWIHFEGRNIEEVMKMISFIEKFNNEQSAKDRITISLEMEKPKANVHELIHHGDVVFMSKDYAKYFGHSTAEEAINAFHPKLKKGATLVCAWGDKGAWGSDGSDGNIYHSQAYPPDQLLDTLGAGDTFNAGVICGLNQKQRLLEALTLGCKLAGRKCGLHGFDGVATGFV